jgi:hypothetical protein
MWEGGRTIVDDAMLSYVVVVRNHESEPAVQERALWGDDGIVSI